MENNDYKDEIKRASREGAVEDIVHTGTPGGGYDLRVSNRFGAGEKQEVDERKDI